MASIVNNLFNSGKARCLVSFKHGHVFNFGSSSLYMECKECGILVGYLIDENDLVDLQYVDEEYTCAEFKIKKLIK